MKPQSGPLEIRSSSAPLPVGPYSQAVACGGLLFLSGQIPLDPGTQKLVAGEIEAQTERVIENLAAVLAAGGCSLADVLRTTVYLADLALFPRMNAVYAATSTRRPARPLHHPGGGAASGALIEIDAIAMQAREAARSEPQASKDPEDEPRSGRAATEGERSS